MSQVTDKITVRIKFIFLVRNDLKESADACASKIFEKPDDSILRPGPSAAAEGHKRSEVPISVLSAANQKMPTDFSQLICSNSVSVYVV